MTNIVVIGDPFVPAENLAVAAKGLILDPPLNIQRFEWYPEKSRSEFREIIKKLEHDGPNDFELTAEIMAAVETAEYLLVHLAPVSRKLLTHAKKLKIIGTCRGGLEHIDLVAVKELDDLSVINVIRNAEPVADFTIGLMYATVRNIATSAIQVKNGQWPQNFPNDAYKTSFSNLKVGLVGLGHIGKIVAKRLTALGLEVSAYDAFIDQTTLDQEGYQVKLKSLKEIFSESDVVSLHLRVVPETKKLIDHSLLKLMKPSAYLINTARPDIINRADLVECLTNKQIAGAGIDVLWEEPITPNEPLLALDNVVITSHIAGDTIDAIERSPQLLQTEMNKVL
ncbi:NAD(P)-dependent oxidoreductase [Enterococcus xiangfangensis]|uniref:NAD(P)-dependent oxidoreductase n=1 Tax=Enterococcus xiangfangensis TaxID=1296537 RepID=A0ABU3FCZ2_9ENTE|nr:NAD(P)-dependent oxidoreductase [Enterococcus xiangfangensis]MDT2760538.1 NAD(P)-dependent oxidoreductase [Enterococcus xiangfangensis]